MRYTPGNREQWRNWLEKNHGKETEVWLVFLKQHTGKPNVSYNDAVEEALCFGWIDGVKRPDMINVLQLLHVADFSY